MVPRLMLLSLLAYLKVLFYWAVPSSGAYYASMLSPVFTTFSRLTVDEEELFFSTRATKASCSVWASASAAAIGKHFVLVLVAVYLNLAFIILCLARALHTRTMFSLTLNFTYCAAACRSFHATTSTQWDKTKCLHTFEYIPVSKTEILLCQCVLDLHS